MANQSQSPTNTVKVPASAANYTPATLDPELRSHINALLLEGGHVPKIQEQFVHNLNAHSSNWPTLIQAHALALLRSGEATTFPTLFKRVMEDIRTDMATAASASGKPSGATTNGTVEVNGTPAPNKKGNGAATENGTKGGAAAAGGSGPNGASLALPQSVVDDAVKTTKEALESFCEIAENGTT